MSASHPPVTVAANVDPAGVAVPLGGIVCARAAIVVDAGRPTLKLTVRNTGDRPIQVGSHFHFFEANRALAFDRAAAFGMRLAIPASTALRFEPGDERSVTLVPFGGRRTVYGFNNLADGATAGKDAAARKAAAVKRARQQDFSFADGGDA